MDTNYKGKDSMFNFICPLTPLDILTVNKVGECLLKITHDGKVEGNIENASEAGNIFVDSIRINLQTYSDQIKNLSNKVEFLEKENSALKKFISETLRK